MTLQNTYPTPVDEPSAYTGAPNQAQSSHRIYRHPSAGRLGGVCAGIADSMGVDVTLVRVLFVIGTLMTSGGGFVVYLLLWLLLPVGTQGHGLQRAPALDFGPQAGPRVARILMVLGGLWLLSNIGFLPEMGRMFDVGLRVLFWPLLLIGLGYWMLRQNDPNVLAHASDSLRRAGQNLRSTVQSTRRAGVSQPSAGRPGASQPGASRSATVAAAPDAASLSARPLQRSSERMFLGVAGGMARWLQIDPAVVRVLWVLVILGSAGVGLLAYLALGLFMPLEGGALPGAHATAAHATAVHAADELQDVPLAPAAPTQPAAPAGGSMPAAGAAPDGVVHL